MATQNATRVQMNGHVPYARDIFLKRWSEALLQEIVVFFSENGDNKMNVPVFIWLQHGLELCTSASVKNGLLHVTAFV